ncbi:HTH_Tnp_Tc3_2 domain-containing protein [Trichonephila clavipes]|nr:HTH_Tnp_Tc3_2 domain-containing protein [Trichonephila clavipes]
MPSPVQSNCDAHDTIANGQYGAVWSMGHTQQDDISVFCRRPTSNTTSPCHLLHIPVVLNDFHSRETTLQGYLRMSQQRDLPESIAWRVIGRLESGQTQRSVADAVGVVRSVVARLWNRFQETGNLTARRNRTENATQLQRQLLLTTGLRMSSQTVRNRLHEGGLYARRPMVCIPLTPRHRAARRRWDTEHRDWEQHDWSQVLFTYESRFSLECDTRRVLVWRDRGTRNNPAFVRERS